MPKNTSAKVAIGFFTIFFQCALHSLTNSIQFALVINTTDKSFNNQMIESIYAELKDNILCQPPIIDPDNIITLILFTKDIFTADAILKRVESFTGVDRVELFALTDTTSYDEWIAREVDKRLNKKTAQDSLMQAFPLWMHLVSVR
ncbi:MAG TPA: hypothetical protein VI278_03585 [Nitrososphaeraceae archaeon]